MRIAIYCQVSTEGQAEDEKTSLQTQLDGCLKLAQSDEVLYQFSETFSGLKLERPKLNELRQLVRLNFIDVIIVYNLDRFTRDPVHGAILFQELDDYHVTLKSVTETVESSDIGRLISYIRGYAAKQESLQRTERTMRGKIAIAKRDGTWLGGYLKYGYQYLSKKKAIEIGAKHTGLIELHPEESKIVLDCFESIASGMTISQWCHRANKRGIPTKRNGKGWVPQIVSLMLRYRDYLGQASYFKTKFDRKRQQHIEGKEIPITCPQIISEDLFNRVRLILKEHKVKNPGWAKKKGKVYLLQHLGRCECGGRICYRTNGHKMYLCCQRQITFPHLHEQTKPKSWNPEIVENFVWAEVHEILENYQEDTFKYMVDRLEVMKGTHSEEVNNARNQVKVCATAKQKILSYIAKGFVSDDEAESQLGELNKSQLYWVFPLLVISQV